MQYLSNYPTAAVQSIQNLSILESKIIRSSMKQCQKVPVKKMDALMKLMMMKNHHCCNAFLLWKVMDQFYRLPINARNERYLKNSISGTFFLFYHQTSLSLLDISSRNL